MNFISGSGPQHSLSTHSIFNEDASDEQHGKSNNYGNKSSSNYSRIGGASVPPPPSLGYRNSKGYTDPNEVLMQHSTFAGTQSSSSMPRAFANLGRKRVADEDE
ncbi:unnamed protein product [Trichobilharzia regenti]|nr:unnamed protein product [Trichobilharzia regenti]